MKTVRGKMKLSLVLALGLTTGVALAAENPTYCVIDLSAGATATSYPVTYLDAEPTGGFNTTEYKTSKLVLRRISAGTFIMGSNQKAESHRVTLTQPFYMGLFEVTQKQWELVMEWNPSPSEFKGEARPVEQVSYVDIRGWEQGSQWPASNAVDEDSFLGRLRAKTGQAFDLPTSAQWEYACRAGSTTAYWWGTKMDGRFAWYDGNAGAQTHEVGMKGSNPWGLYDINGNVWEWCLDWDGSLSYGTDPKGPASPASGWWREFRGGGWETVAAECNSTYRDQNGPQTQDPDIGFRLVLTLEKADVSPAPDDPSPVEPKPFTVTFDANGGAASADSANYAKGETLGDLPTASRDGHAFVGWFTRPSGGTQVTSATKVTKSVTYYARWTEIVVPVAGSERLSATFDGLAKRTFGGLVFDANGRMAGLAQLATAKAARDGSVSVKGFVMLEDGKKQTVKAAKGTVQDGLLTVRTTVGKLGTLDVTFGYDGFVGKLGDLSVESADVGEDTGILRGTIRLSYLDAKTGAIKTRQVTLTGLTDNGEAAGTLSAKGREPQTFQSIVE